MVTSANNLFLHLKRSGKPAINVLRIAAATAATIGITTAAFAQGSTIEIDGSSTVFPITEAMAEEFRAAGNDTNISVGVSGTGGGFKKFCAGETVISDASRPIKDTEIELCAANGIEYTIIPVAYDAITVVVNPANDWATDLTVEELKKIWEPAAEGTITSWSQVNSAYPNVPINLFGPGTDSGTFDYFTDEIVGEEGASRGDYTASEDDNVLVLGVSRDPNAMGYFGMSYYLENQDQLKALGIYNEETGEAVVPSPETIEEYKPLSREIYIYVNNEALANRPEVMSFVEFYLDNAEEIVPETGYVALPTASYEDSMGML
ncbi:MAG: PstS family phosphate ABC transporter substrate-binding protein [Phormidesmis sp.]